MSEEYEKAFVRYMRTGEILPPMFKQSDADCGYPVPPRWASMVTELAAKRGPRRGASDNAECYVNLAATATLLLDDDVDLGRWLAQESEKSFSAMAADGAAYDAGTMLRDPYSAKPYVLFYYVRRRLHPSLTSPGE